MATGTPRPASGESSPPLHQAGKRLKRIAANEADPDRQARLKQAAQQLDEIHAAIKTDPAVNLTPGQIEAYNRAWDTLEAIRREKAMSLHDAAVTIVEEPTATEPAAEERYAIAS